MTKTHLSYISALYHTKILLNHTGILDHIEILFESEIAIRAHSLEISGGISLLLSSI